MTTLTRVYFSIDLQQTPNCASTEMLKNVDYNLKKENASSQESSKHGINSHWLIMNQWPTPDAFNPGGGTPEMHQRWCIRCNQV